MSGDDWYHCNECGGIGCSRRRSELEAMGMFRDGWVFDVICPYSMKMTAFKWEEWQGDERMDADMDIKFRCMDCYHNSFTIPYYLLVDSEQGIADIEPPTGWVKVTLYNGYRNFRCPSCVESRVRLEKARMHEQFALFFERNVSEYSDSQLEEIRKNTEKILGACEREIRRRMSE